MQMVGALVQRQLECFAIEREAAVADAVAIAAAGGAEIGVGGDIGGDVVEAEHDVGHLTGATWSVQLGQPRAIGNQLGRQAVAIAQDEATDDFPVQMPEHKALDHSCSPPSLVIASPGREGM